MSRPARRSTHDPVQVAAVAVMILAVVFCIALASGALGRAG